MTRKEENSVIYLSEYTYIEGLTGIQLPQRLQSTLFPHP